MKIIKQKLNKQMPDACEAVMGSGVEAREEDDEYDEAIRKRRQQVTSRVLLDIIHIWVPWFHPIFWKVEPWNHGTKVPGYTFWVPWFHGST